MTLPPSPPVILVADADSANRDYAEERLAAEGFKVVCVADGVSAMAELGSRPFDLAMISLDLQGLDGLSLLSAMRDDATLSRLPTLVVVQRDELDGVDRAFAAGATAFAARPLHWKALAHPLRFLRRNADQVEALRIAKEKAEQADAFKANMMRLLQHELRTPLASIVGFSEEIARAPTSRYSAEFASHVVKAGRQLNRQFSALFESAQVIMGDVRWDFDALTVQDLFDEIRAGEEAFADARGVHLRFGIDCPGAVLEADRRFLPKAIRHIVRNAVVHGGAATQGERRVDVVATGKALADREIVLIAVRDYGPGMSEEALSRCMEPFGQAEDALTRSEHGFGLGLPFAKRVLDAHGGSLRIAEPDGGGCLVTVGAPARLPATMALPALKSA